MPTRRTPRARPGLALATALLASTLHAAALAAQSVTSGKATDTATVDTATVDTAAAIRGVADYQVACRRDGGRLWGRSLCGNLIVVDPATRTAVANAAPPGGTFVERGGVWIGRVPDGIPLANTSLTWVGRPWAIALLPLPARRFDRAQLLLHESFHRIQDSLQLRGPDALNPHLDEREGRYWLRLELRALRAALLARGAPARAAAGDALLFRAVRYRIYPGADTLEAALELQEGLAEYTGAKLAGAVVGGTDSAVAAQAEAFEARPTFVRSLGYGTGPLLGLLLDRWAPRWRERVRSRGFAAQLATALGFTPPVDPLARARERARAYDDGTLAAAEDARARVRADRVADYRARLVRGPVLVLRQDQLMRSFNPNTLFPLPGEGTVYPTGTFSAAWGTLTVTDGGALVAPDFTLLRVPAPADTTGRPIRGPGWTLELAPGWTLRPGEHAGERAGDLTVAPGPGAASPAR